MARPGAERGARWSALGAAVLAATVAAAFALRASLPNGQHPDESYRGQSTDPWVPPAVNNGFDDAATLVVARNFARDGFLHSGLLENRKGAPEVALFNPLFHWCEGLGPTRDVLRYRLQGTRSGGPDPAGAVWQDMAPLDNDCVYAHYPPLVGWVFGGMASAGLDRILWYRLLVIALNALFLLLLHGWLAAEVRPGAALVAVAFLATAPAFITWGQALHHQAFQYALLLATLLAWRRHVRTGRRRWAVLSWGFFLFEALASPELILFTGIVLAATLALDGEGSAASRLRRLAVQATAPAAALLLVRILDARLHGAGAAAGDIGRTLLDRAWADASVAGFRLYLGAASGYLLGPGLAAGAVAAVAAVRAARGEGLRRPLIHLGTFLAGGLSFAAVFPGTTSVHPWMMYRHLMPFAALAVAYLCDSVPAALALARQAGRRRALGLAALLVAAATFGALAWRNGVAVRAEVAFHRARNLQHDPANLAVRFLDAVYWKERGPVGFDPRVLMPLDGRRVNLPADPQQAFELEPATLAHYEVWWLEDMTMREVRALTEARTAAAFAARCRLSVFTGDDFHAGPPLEAPRVEPFVPAEGESPAPNTRWVRFAFSGTGRALRLSCDELPEATPLHELEVR
jgi:hypothetical protein